MYSDTGHRPHGRRGFPIRKSSDHSPLIGSPRHIADCHVLHRLLMPRHPPCALSNLQTDTHRFISRIRCSRPLYSSQTTPAAPLTVRHAHDYLKPTTRNHNHHPRSTLPGAARGESLLFQDPIVRQTHHHRAPPPAPRTGTTSEAPGTAARPPHPPPHTHQGAQQQMPAPPTPRGRHHHGSRFVDIPPMSTPRTHPQRARRGAHQNTPPTTDGERGAATTRRPVRSSLERR